MGGKGTSCACWKLSVIRTRRAYSHANNSKGSNESRTSNQKNQEVFLCVHMLSACYHAFCCQPDPSGANLISFNTKAFIAVWVEFR
jgi:hypothetical protein